MGFHPFFFQKHFCFQFLFKLTASIVKKPGSVNRCFSFLSLMRPFFFSTVSFWFKIIFSSCQLNSFSLGRITKLEKKQQKIQCLEIIAWIVGTQRTILTAIPKVYFFVFLQVLDDKNVRRRFRASNYQSTTRVKPFICTMPMRLDDGWNQIQFNLSDFTRRAYGTNYIETLRVQVNLLHKFIDLERKLEHDLDKN